MLTLTGKHIDLRALEPEDLEFVHHIENDESLWELSHTQTPYSRNILRQYIENSHLDIYQVKQLRLMIENKSKQAVGMIDVFDFDPKNKRAGIGILVIGHQRGMGLGKEALQLLCKYCFTHLGLHQVYANIDEGNLPSIRLFEGQGFQRAGTKKEWNFSQGTYKNEHLYQLINNVY